MWQNLATIIDAADDNDGNDEDYDLMRKNVDNW